MRSGSRADRRALVPAAAALVLVAGCGGSSPSALRQTSDHLADIHSGTLELRLGLVPSGSPGVAVSLAGPFALGGHQPLPLADVRYVQTAGQRVAARFISTGTRAYVTTAGRTVRLTGSQLSGLRVGQGDTKSLDDLGLHVDRWIVKPRTGPGPRVDGVATQRITGRLDARQALGDLARVAGRAGISPQEVERLSRTVSGSSVAILAGKADHLLRQLHLSVSLSLPPELRAKTGGKAALTATVELGLRNVNRPVHVRPPAGT